MFFKSKFGSAGASPRKVVSVSADEVSKALLSGETFLKYADHHSFWSTLTTERDVCSRYVARIINLLMNFEADPSKMEKQLQKTSVVSIEYFLVILINTLHFLDMFVGIDPTNGAFVSSIEKYEAKKRSNPRFKLKRVDEALNELSRRRNQRGHVAVKLVVDCASLDSDGEMHRAMQRSMSDMMFLDESGLDNLIDSTRSDYPFVFTCLSRIARSDSAPQVFDEMLRQLNGGAGCTLSALPHMQGRTLAILLMLRELLTQNPTNDDSWMQRASSIVSSFYKWPKPYGPFARSMIQFIDIERRSPGWHFRERIASEFPELRPQLIPELSGAAEASWRGGLGNTLVFMDGSSDVSKAFAGIFSMGSLSHDTATSVATTPAGTELKRKIVTHTIELDFSLRDYGSEVENNDPLFLSSKSDDEVHGWYVKVMSICARAKTLPCDSDSKDVEHSDPKYLPPGGLAKLFREAYFSEIIHEIAPGLSYVARRSPMFDKSAVPAAAVRKSTTVIPGSAANPKITMTPPNSPIMGEEERHRSLTALENDIDDEELDAVDDLNRPNLVIPDQVMYFGENSPSVPPVQFSAFEFCPDVLVAPSSSKRISVPLNSREIKYQNDILDVSALRQAVQASLCFKNGAKVVTLKVMLIGGNFVVHKFLCAYIALASKDRQLFIDVQLELFIVPTVRNDLASFLAHSDKWYRRHIYYPFIGPVGICPQFDFCRDASTAENLGLSVPMKCTQSLLEDFVRQAHQTVNTSIFECLCWAEYSGGRSTRSDGQAEDPTVCIPFVMSMEIGVFVQASIYRTQMAQAAADPSKKAETRDMSTNVPTYDSDSEDMKELFLSKNFSPTSTELSISYAPSTMSGDVGEESVLKTGQYMTVSLNNLPDMFDDFGLPLRKNKTEFEVPNCPDNGVLVMNSRSGRGNLKELLANRKKNLKGKSDWFLEALIDSDSFDIPVNISIVDIVAVNPLESFHVLIDGRIFGPFKRIVVQPCQVPTGNESLLASTLPIKSFLPVSL